MRGRLVNRITGLKFDEFETTMRGVRGHYIPVGSSTRDWQMHHVPLVDMDIMVGQNGGGAIYEGACHAGNFGLFIPLSEPGSLAVNGEQAGTTTLSWLVPEREFRVYNSDVFSWIGVSVAGETVHQWLDLTHEDFRPDLHSHRIGAVEGALMRRLQDIIQRMAGASDTGNATMDDASQAMLHAQLSWAIYEAVQSAGGARSAAQGRPRLSRGVVLGRALQWLETTDSDSIYMTDLCKVAGVSSRTLHAVFMESFGVSPYRFLVLKRLRKIHDALKQAGPGDTVAGVCRRFGVWDFGRFSDVYRRVYGVLPSGVIASNRRAHPSH
ncbi:AraC family transcriptional regulator [Dyella telluris]|uniref:Helix-turn-helix domain-containing protein n=1 Tax=Dyella telluris TaxID=2763498 RepID=A0A7G8Q3A9_9GAMM|nr:AraC family transcriptional regulator [Dyella telluris]QNK01267.1 helix-turn-helix domain-containing protein [Dyella telluris]